MILDGVVSATGQPLGNQSPFVAYSKFILGLLFVCLDDGLVLIFRPSFFFDVRVEMVVPPLSALLPDPSW